MSEDKKINPAHYKLSNGIEANDVTMHFGFNEGNVIKYVWRAGKKGGEYRLTDLKKAQWYLNNLVKELENEDEGSGNEKQAADKSRGGEDGKQCCVLGSCHVGDSHSSDDRAIITCPPCNSECSDYDHSICRAYGVCPAGFRGFA